MESSAIIERPIESSQIYQLDLSLVDNLIHDSSDQPLSESSKETYKCTIRQFNEFIDQRNLTVNEDSIRLYFDSLSDLAPSTLNAKRSALLKILKLQIGSDSIIKRLAVEKVFSEKVKRYKVNKTVHDDECLSEKQIKQLIKVAPTKKTELMIRFLFVTGCRVTEAINIKWKDIKLINGLCRIRIVGKGNKERFTYAPADLIEAIRCEYAGEKWLFESSSGRQLHRVNVTNAIKNTGRKLGWKISAHSLRHSRATDMLKKGISLRAVSDHLGHADVSTTAALYIHDSVNYHQLFAMDSI